MTQTAFCLTPADPDWDAWVARAPHDFYHSAAYHAFAEGQGEGQAFMVGYGTPEQFLILPYLLREIDEDHCDATSVYGYTGPIGRGLEDSGFVVEAWAAFRAHWRTQRLVTLFTRFHPLLENARVAEAMTGETEPAGGERVLLGRSVSMDLSLDEDTRRMGYPQPLRQEIKKAERNGLTVKLDPDWTAYPEFMELYRATMAKNNASDRYIFTDDYFDRLKQSLTGVAHMSVAYVEDQVAAAMVFTVCGSWSAAHLTGINPAFNKYSPLKPLIDRTAELAHDMGATHFHLGAGRGGAEDSLFDFKSRFSDLRHDFVAGRWILDAEACNRLTRDVHGDLPPDLGFFPGYRAPVAKQAAE